MTPKRWTCPIVSTSQIRTVIRGQAEHAIAEYSFEHQTQWALCPSRSYGERAQWVPFSLLCACQRKLTEFFIRRTHRVWRRTQWVLSCILPISHNRQIRTPTLHPQSFCILFPSCQFSQEATRGKRTLDLVNPLFLGRYTGNQYSKICRAARHGSLNLAVVSWTHMTCAKLR